MASIPLDLVSTPWSIFAFVKENNATSAPDISAEPINNTISITTLIMNEISKELLLIYKTVGSGSKLNILLFKMVNHLPLHF